MSKHPIPAKRYKRQCVGLATIAIACVAIICMILAELWGGGETSDDFPIEQAKPLSEETAIHPQEYLAEEVVLPFSDAEIEMAAKTVWGEARGIDSQMEQAAIVWCFLNRYDRNQSSFAEIISAPGQFYYNPDAPTVDDRGRDLTVLVEDVVIRWMNEKAGQENVGRVLPPEYLYFGGDGEKNYFRTSYESFDNIWDWSLPNPYGMEVSTG